MKTETLKHILELKERAEKHAIETEMVVSDLWAYCLWVGGTESEFDAFVKMRHLKT